MPGAVLRRLEHKGLVTCHGAIPGRFRRTSVLVWALAEPSGDGPPIELDTDDPTSRLVRAILDGYTAGDVAALRRLWHPHVEVFSRDGSFARGPDAVEHLVRTLVEEQRVGMDPTSVRIAGDTALVDGCVLLGPERTRDPVIWAWLQQDGLLRRSVTLTTPAARIPVPSAGAGR